ncbi:RcnB family protein [Sphingomonas sp. 8AM]|uniref:RcnB family protein n=1 Tax=Sphingomonas sp. 8AM TaxID=2653170 RepID=UPI0012EFCF62|nr:RcnB family protein [Sphingomonas sp. 8AM]VXC93908.1 Membrane protein [Sphingomonas sp. 8AM]
MRHLVTAALLAATALSGVVASAPVAAQSRDELRRDRQDIRQEQRQLDRARVRGDWRDARAQRDDLRDARRDYREDRRDLRQQRQWQRDRREWRADMQQWRAGHRDLYARGGWQAPFRYQAFRPGGRIAPSYYGTRYVIADPWRYRLPTAPGRARWVRHYDDALLVDQRRGIVLDVVRGFYF